MTKPLGFENVFKSNAGLKKGFRSHDKGNIFKVVKETLKNFGYKV